MAWGLGAVGVIGSLAALLLGYNTARIVRYSLHQLSVSVQVATEKLGQTLPTVTIDENGDFDQVHGQVQGLAQEIEKVVQRLNQREREALRAKQLAAVGQVAAGVAHELRNPLTSIKLLIHANRQEAARHGLQVDDFDVVEQEIRRMDRCLQTFLDFARPPQAARRRRSVRHPLRPMTLFVPLALDTPDFFERQATRGLPASIRPMTLCHSVHAWSVYAGGDKLPHQITKRA
jgi:signal transduction histidine kinase